MKKNALFMKHIVTTCLIGIVFAGCNNQIKEKPTVYCKTYDAQCEKDKDYQFVKILDFQDKVGHADVYGLPLQRDHWYVHSNKGGTLIPVDENPDHNFSRNDYELADKADGHTKLNEFSGDIKSDTTDINGHAEGSGLGLPVKVKMLEFGPRSVQVSFDGDRLHYYWIK